MTQDLANVPTQPKSLDEPEPKTIDAIPIVVVEPEAFDPAVDA